MSSPFVQYVFNELFDDLQPLLQLRLVDFSNVRQCVLQVSLILNIILC